MTKEKIYNFLHRTVALSRVVESGTRRWITQLRNSKEFMILMRYLFLGSGRLKNELLVLNRKVLLR